ncbi:MAG: immunoglobulin domain-containing protein [Verrucomicrobiae bacterium]|nr:immunoglobulin domain-containing protein [Verrucomicrobiae bacterium]
MQSHSFRCSLSRNVLGVLAAALSMGLMALATAAEGPPVITNNLPGTLIVLQDSAATFSLGADGTAPLSYQWYRNGNPITGATASSYTLPSAQPADDLAQFFAVVTNSLGRATSAVAVLRVDPGVPGPSYGTNLITIANTVWRYNQNSGDLGTGWKEPSYNDSAWPTGLGLLGYETTPEVYAPFQFRTPLTAQANGGQVTVYFRTKFNFNGDPAMTTLVASNLIDDGAVFYLNGVYVGNIRVGSAPNHSYSTGADTTKDPEGVIWDVINIPSTALVRGENTLAVEVKQSGTASSDIVVGIELFATVSSRVRDTNGPVAARIIPTPGLAVSKLFTVEVLFDEPVTNVNASDLLINGVPAANVIWQPPTSYIFEFPQPPTGVVTVAWAPNHGITDLSLAANPFAGGQWTYLLDPNMALPPLYISEFLASNSGGYTNVIRDEDGEYSDWIEIYNAGTETANLDGWFLTDDPANLTKWRFPAVSLAGNRYLVVFASGKDRRSPNGRLHANFNLAREGEYLALVSPRTNVVMQFAPAFPPQQTGVSYGLVTGTTNTFGYFVVPTPGSANTAAGAGFAPEVRFSRTAGTFWNNFYLELSTPHSNAVIRYVTGNAQVTETSPIYTGPLLVTNTVLVRARAYVPGLLPGPRRSEAFIRLDNSVLTNKSDLPLIILHDYGQGDPPTSKPDWFVICQVFMPKNGVSSLTNKPDLSFQGIFHRRGSSTVGQTKANLLVEAQDEAGNDMDVPFCGLPEESDWVLYAPNNFDRVQIHNPVAHDIYRQMGYYSSRNQMAELYLQDDAGTIGPVKQADYHGIYVVLEKIKIGKNRLDIGKVRPEETNVVNITGGYLVSVDRANTGESQFTAGNQTMNYLDPDYAEMVSAAYTPQRNYLNNFFNNFYTALTGANWRDPVVGYAAYIDSIAWVDYHIQNVVTFNIDGLRLSGYLHKERWDPEVRGSGKLKWGPQWDYDRTQGSADGRDFNPRLWRSTAGDLGTDMFNSASIFANPWYSRLFQDIDFWQLWVDRYQMWRQSVLSLTNIHAMIDYYGNLIRNAHPRDMARWPEYAPRSGTQSGSGYSYTFPSPGTLQGELTWMKFWYSNRFDFIDGQFVRQPTSNREGGAVTPGTTVTLTGPGVGTVYYTLDGRDPRAPGGTVAPYALTYTGPITLTNNAKLVARTYNVNHTHLTGAGNPPLISKWSGPLTATYVVATPQLAITEIMYNGVRPPGNTNSAEQFEWIELKNIGTTAIPLAGYRFTNGFDYIFPSNAPVLAPNAYIVIAKNPAAFSAKYPGVTNVVGGYYGFLDNAGERLTLVGSLDEPIANFAYNNSWYRMSDGNDFSLVLANEYAAFSTYTNRATWRLSTLEGGSPGAQDPAPASIPPVYINEVLAFPLPGQKDAIELYNPNNFAVDISYWYLSDDFGTPKKYRIPAGTIIPANGYLVFTEDQFNAPGAPNGFGLGARGDDVYLFSANAAGKLTGYYHGFDFGAAPQGMTLGRLVDSVGDDKFVLQAAPSLGTNNAGPAISPVVITEIMYHPPDIIEGTNVIANYRDEFIELYNHTASPVALYDVDAPTNTWFLRDAVTYVFPMNTVMPPRSYLLVVPFDPALDPAALAAFRARYQVPEGVPIYGPWEGRLNNDGDMVELVRPGVPALLAGTGLYAIPEILVDKVGYSNTTPWPCGTSGTGNSLQRLQANAFGNEPANWVADVPTPGGATVPKPAGLPTIVNHPLLRVIPVGGSATFNVGVCGLPPFYYQWQFNGTNIPNATNSFHTVANAQLTQAGLYSVLVSNAAGTVASLPAQLYVQTPPGIAQNPQSQTVLGYTTVTFSVTPQGTPPFWYQWRFDGGDIVGATNQTLVLTNVQGSQAGAYSVRVYNTAGSIISANAMLTVNLPAKIWTQPADLRVTNGTTANLSVVANGHGALSYQWFFNGTPIPGATTNSLVITNFSLAQEGYYSVLVTNVFGAELSRQAFVKWLLSPVITRQPQANQVLTAGSNLVLSIEYNASQPHAVRWQNPNNAVPGYDFDRNSPVMVLENVHVGLAGVYRATITNELRTNGLSSGLAFVTVVEPPRPVQVLQGSNATLAVRFGGQSQTFQWMRNGTNISGATTATLTLPNVQPEQAGEYILVVRSGTVSNLYPVQLTVQTEGVAPVITESPTNRTVITNGYTMFVTAVTGTEPLALYWYHNRTNWLTNAASSILTLTNLALAQSGTYQLVASNAYGMATSATAVLTVAEPPGLVFAQTNRYIRRGASFALTPTMTGTGPFTYQWYRSPGTLLAGATGMQLAFEDAQPEANGGYYVVASNAVGVATSAVVQVWVLDPPVVTQNPASVNTTVGGSVTFTAAASGAAPLAYQWFFNNSPLPGATSATLQITNVQPQHAGQYYLRVTNLVGSAFSATVALTLGSLDSDNDGLPDEWEAQYGLQTNNPNDAQEDSDGDGLTNLQEYIAGTDPRNPASVLKLSIQPANGGAAGLQFQAISNKSYTIQYLDRVGATQWQRFLDVAPAPTNRQVGITNQGGPSRFYRIATPQLP